MFQPLRERSKESSFDIFRRVRIHNREHCAPTLHRCVSATLSRGPKEPARPTRARMHLLGDYLVDRHNWGVSCASLGDGFPPLSCRALFATAAWSQPP